MKREDVKAIFAEATDEQLEKIMALHGSDVEKYKGEAATLKTEAAEKKKAFDLLRGEFERLKESNAGAADYKKKFEDLQRDIADKEKAAAQKQAAEERAAEISRRYAAAADNRSDQQPIFRDIFLIIPLAIRFAFLSERLSSMATPIPITVPAKSPVENLTIVSSLRKIFKD